MEDINKNLDNVIGTTAETEPVADASTTANDPWNFYNNTMSTVPTHYESHGGPRFTPAKPKRRHIKHGHRKKK